MESNIIFDTLAYSKKLIAAGFTEKQAEVQAELLAEIIEERIATKRDLKELETSLQHEIRLLEQRVVIKLGALIAASIAIVATLVKLL